jgi:IS605 OrfB family transposase
MQRTIRILLKPTPVQAEALGETSRQFTAVFNAVCAYGWREQERNGVRLHHALYRPLKGKYPALVSDLHIQARVKATEAVRSALALHRAGKKVAQPLSRSCPPRYNLHTYKIDWHGRSITLSTTGGRFPIPFALLPHAEKYVGGEVDSADLIQRKGKWWLHVVVTLPQPKVGASDAVVGVDLGLVRPAVTSNNRFLGKRAWKASEGRYFKLRRALQKRAMRSAKRHLRKLRGKQARFRRDCDHVLSKQVVQATAPGGTLLLENLTNIRKRTKLRRKTSTSRRIHAWSFAQLRGFIEYKAEERGCTVAGVDPGIPRSVVAAAGIPPATTAAPATCLCVGPVATRFMPTSMGRATSLPNTVPSGVHLLPAGCLSTSLSRPPRRLRRRGEVQAVAFTRQSVDMSSPR